MKKLILAVTALLLPFAFYSCKSGDDDSSSAVEQENNSGNNSGNADGNTSSNLTADFEDYSNSTYLLKVKNNTAKKLVAFKGTPASDTLIGGIPASATNHALPKSSTLFSASQDFILFIVTEDDFTAHKDSLSSLENSPSHACTHITTQIL